MTRGKRWSPLEIKLLQDMVEQGLAADKIFKSGKFPNRTYDAIRMEIQRLSFVQQRKSSVEQITEGQIVGLESFVKRYVDAFNKLCDLTDYNKTDLERFRLIHTYARDYPTLLAEHERLKQVEDEISELRKAVEEIKAQIARSTEAN